MYTKKELIQANKHLLAKDESDLWPINGRFNVTKRSIRKVQRAMRDGLQIEDIEEYTMLIEDIVSDIVNGEI